MQMCGLPFDVSFRGKDIGIVGLAGVGQIADQPHQRVGLLRGKLHQYRCFDGVDVRGDVDLIPEVRPPAR
jgi:hypothetical protein